MNLSVFKLSFFLLASISSVAMADFHITSIIFTANNSTKQSCVIDSKEALLQDLNKPGEPSLFKTQYLKDLDEEALADMILKYRISIPAAEEKYVFHPAIETVSTISISGQGLPLILQGGAPPSECNGSAPGCGGDFRDLAILKMERTDYENLIRFVFFNCRINEPKLFNRLMSL